MIAVKKFCIAFLFCAVSSFLLSACGSSSDDTSSPGQYRSTAHDYSYFAFSSFNAVFQQAAKISTCNAGELTDAVRHEVIETLNKIRFLSDLGPVQYNYFYDNEVKQAALIMAANENVSHEPPNNWRCYSTIAADGAGSSNIGYGYQIRSDHQFSLYKNVPNGDLIAWLTDVDNVAANNVGHRRWLLSPFLYEVSYASVVDQITADKQVFGSAIKVLFDDGINKPANAFDTIIAYPKGNYPQHYFQNTEILSVSLLIDAQDYWANKEVNFSQAQLTVIQRSNGEKQRIQQIEYDNLAVGLPNNLQFKLPNLKKDTIYDVEISHVQVQRTWKNYSYWFQIVSN